MRPNIGSIAPPTGTLLSATHYQCLPSWGATVIGPGIHIGRLMTLYCLFVCFGFVLQTYGQRSKPSYLHLYCLQKQCQ